MLKSTEGWNNNGNGSDSYFFSALPAGDRDFSGDFVIEGYDAYFWSSSGGYSSGAYFMYLDCNYDSAYMNNGDKGLGFSVRCVRD